MGRASLSIRLLGRFRVVQAGRPVAGLEGLRVQELLAYLILRGDRPLRREVLAETLFGCDGAVSGRKSLRHALWQLQSALAKCEPAPGSLVTAHQEWIQFDDTAEPWVDVHELDRARLHVCGTQGEHLSPPAVHLLRSAVGHYRGELLEGCYADWCLDERERYRSVYLDVLDKLVANAEARGRVEEGIADAEVILGHDRASERTHRRLMRLRYRGGDRTGALRQFDRCATALREELGVAPAAQTVGLRKCIELDLQVPSGESFDGSTSSMSDEPTCRPWPTPIVRPAMADTRAVLRSVVASPDERPIAIG